MFFVDGFAGLVCIKPGESVPVPTKSQEELLDIHNKYESALHKLDANKANNSREWWIMRRKVWCEYGPLYQAWSDRHKLGHQFKWDTRDEPR